MALSVLTTKSYEIAPTDLITSLQIYDKRKGESYKDKTRYTTSVLITNLALKECRLHLGQGTLNDEIIYGISKWLYDEGYTDIQFEVPAGTSASRFSTFVDSKDGLDRYKCNLEEAFKKNAEMIRYFQDDSDEPSDNS